MTKPTPIVYSLLSAPLYGGAVKGIADLQLTDPRDLSPEHAQPGTPMVIILVSEPYDPGNRPSFAPDRLPEPRYVVAARQADWQSIEFLAAGWKHRVVGTIPPALLPAWTWAHFQCEADAIVQDSHYFWLMPHAMVYTTEYPGQAASKVCTLLLPLSELGLTLVGRDFSAEQDIQTAINWLLNT